MSRYILYKTIFFFFLSLTGTCAVAQSKTSIKATVDKNKILIGEPIQLTLEADIPENEAIRFFTIDTLPHFEILHKEPIDTSDTDDGTALRQVIRITSFDSGHWVIPSLLFMDELATDSIPVDVVFSDFNPEQDYHDVKDIIEVNPVKKEEKPWWYWAAIGAGALLIIGILIYFVRKKKPVVEPPPVVIDPYAEAMQSLEKLQREKLDQKRYYSELVDIFRVYVSKVKGIHSLQKTTDDLVMQLKSINMPKEQFDKLAQSLRLSDFVKFAKYVPSPEDDKNAIDTIKTTISVIEQLK